MDSGEGRQGAGTKLLMDRSLRVTIQPLEQIQAIDLIIGRRTQTSNDHKPVRVARRALHPKSLRAASETGEGVLDSPSSRRAKGKPQPRRE
jgi:hypothetical protein